MQIARIDESRHVPAIADGEQTQRQACRHRDDHHRIVRQAGAKAADVKGAGYHRDAGVKLAAEEQRDVVAEHVAQHAADAARDHSRHDDDEKRQVEIERAARLALRMALALFVVLSVLGTALLIHLSWSYTARQNVADVAKQLNEQIVASIRTELTDLAQVEAESAKLYRLLQDAVDREIQEVGFMPDASATA